MYRKRKVGETNFFNKTIMDEARKAELTAQCACGSGKMAGQCCKKGEPCFCGSGKPVGECCMANPEAHGMPPAPEAEAMPPQA